MDKKKIYRELEEFQETRVRDEFKKIQFTIVLVQPENAGNIGSIARIMKNFDFDDLVIFNPIESVENIVSHEAQGFAMHGKEVLLNARIFEVENQEDHESEFNKFLNPFDLVIGTTAKGKHYSNLQRLAIFPEDLDLPISKTKLDVAILFGKESRGLTNEELKPADILLRIPTSQSYPTLNLSHACGIILYNIFKKIHSIKVGRGKHPILLAKKEDRKILYGFLRDIIQKLKIRTHKKENVLIAFKNVFERAFMSKKELSLITGLFSKIHSILMELDLYD